METNLLLKTANILKYGCNSHQGNANICSVNGSEIPFDIINGNPGYINILDAINSWYLVNEIKYSINKIAAASFKHVSPAGVSIGNTSYEAYLNARGCDPKSSFGDFIGVNSNVTVELANYIKTKVSDGIIAPSYDSDALDILKSKKKGNFIILLGKQIDLNKQDYTEYRVIKNIALTQKNNSYVFGRSDLLQDFICTKNRIVPDHIIEDLVLSNITLKYTQSNSVCITYNGKTIGIGAGQQSRIDCVKLARRKAEIYLLRNNNSIIEQLKFKNSIKYQERVNATIQYIENDMSDNEYKLWKNNFDVVPEKINIDKNKYFNTIDNISISSDGFFPFRDSIDQASLINVKYVSQPGGSIADTSVTNCCDEYGMVMFNSNIRSFHH